ncbi:MAG: cytochrome o ubiquinol oxidase subunit III [Candidatus Saccharimonadales bacterium]|jgi:cytochrome o ubiquinol oxidase subunit 3
MSRLNTVSRAPLTLHSEQDFKPRPEPIRHAREHPLAGTGTSQSKVQLGFWIYLMTDCILFATLFATFMVLRGQTAGGVSGTEIFDLPYVFIETILLLLSSFASGLALLSAHARNKAATLSWLAVVGLFGAAFLGMELYEFHGLVAEGHNWKQSAFLSSYFGLVGTHGLHIFTGLVWLGASALYLKSRGFSRRFMTRLQLFTMFWHFLDLVWVGIFTIVYLLGVM